MKFILPLLLCLLLLGCSAEKYSPTGFPNENALFGKWRLVSYADDKAIPFDVTIELKSEKDSVGRYIMSGKSTLNFYFSTFEIDEKSDSITVYDIQSTKINGSNQLVSFEKNYYEMLSKIKRYELGENGETLKLLLPATENQHLTYKLVP